MVIGIDEWSFDEKKAKHYKRCGYAKNIVSKHLQGQNASVVMVVEQQPLFRLKEYMKSRRGVLIVDEKRRS